MDNDVVIVAAAGGFIGAAGEIASGDIDQGVDPPGRPGFRFGGDVVIDGAVRFHGDLDGFHDELSHLLRQLGVEGHAAVVMGAAGEISRLEDAVGIIGGQIPPRVSERLAMLFHLEGGVIECIFDQLLFVVRAGDTGQGSRFRVSESTVAERFGDERQAEQFVGDAHPFAGGAERQLALPVEPLGAVVHVICGPALANVELAHIAQKQIFLGVDARGAGDQVGFQLVERTMGDRRFGLCLYDSFCLHGPSMVKLSTCI